MLDKKKKTGVSKSAVRPAKKSAPKSAPKPAVQDAAVQEKPKKAFVPREGFDYAMFTIVMILLAFGVIMMFSASYANAYYEKGDSLYYFKRQAVFAVAGVVIMMILSAIDYHLFQKKWVVVTISIVTVGLMAAVKLMGTSQYGSERWIQIGSITFQPSELLKFAVIVLFAFYVSRHFEHIKEFKRGFCPLALILGLSCLLMIIQPHLSGTIIVFCIGFAMMFVSGVNIKHLLIMIAALAALLVIGILALNALGYDYFSARMLSFTDPEADIQDKTFQTYQSLITIGSGGMFGLGFGNSRQKYNYLPMSRNDFVFSVLCEELGFVGAALVILLFIILVWRGFYIASKARDKFGMMMAFGITFQIGLQALLNIAVVTNSVPNTGISLPFFSYGGTALIMQLAEMGILLSVSRKSELK